MAGFPASASPLVRSKRGSGKTRPVGSFFEAASARKLVGCFVGPVDLAEHHSNYLKAKLRGRAKSSR
jgi:hypothetical protein